MKNINGITYTNDLKNCSHGAYELQEAKILDSVRIIRKNAFSNSALEKVYFPAKLKKIESKAFYNACLKEVNIDKNVYIEESAFANNPALEKINLNSEIIGSKAFLYCKNPKTVNLSNTMLILESTFKFNTFNSLNLPNTLSSIESYAFAECTFNFPVLKLPNNLKTLGNYAFNNSNGLTDVYLPDSLNVIGKNVFGPDVTIHISKELYKKIPNIKELLGPNVKLPTLDDLIEENKSFKEINNLYKDSISIEK